MRGKPEAAPEFLSPGALIQRLDTDTGITQLLRLACFL
jgi:hypothetical protein